MMMREGRKVGRKQGDKRKEIGEKGEEEVVRKGENRKEGHERQKDGGQGVTEST